MVVNRLAPEQGKGVPSDDVLPQLQIRRRLLKDAYQGRQGGASGSYSRKMADDLLRPAPMTSLTREEFDILRGFLIETFTLEQEGLVDTVGHLMRTEKPGELVRRLQVQELWKSKQMSGISPSQTDSLSIWPDNATLLPGLEGWFWKAMDSKIAEKRPLPAVALDVGASGCSFANRVKAKYGDSVIMHASNLESQPHKPVDHHHLLCGEYLPEGFRGGFDIVVAHWAAEMTVLPHIFIGNLARSLSEGGEAGISLNTHIMSGINLVLDEGLKGKLDEYYHRQGMRARILSQLERVNEETPIEVLFDRQPVKTPASEKTGADPGKYYAYVYIKRPKTGKNAGM
jgi:hypothetical protein